MTDQPDFKGSRCPQCEKKLQPEFAYCPYCGQQKIKSRERIKDVLRNFAGDYFAYDSKLALSLKPLMFKPGFLSLEYRRGKRVRYIPPLRLYIFVSIFFFIILNWSGGSDFNSRSTADAMLWNDFFQTYLPRVFFLLLPIFALVLWLLFGKHKTGYVFPLIVSLHYHTFLFLALSGYILLSNLIALSGLYILNLILFSAIGIWALVYLFLALKNIYGKSWSTTIGRFVLLILIYGFILSAVMLVILGYITFSSDSV